MKAPGSSTSTRFPVHGFWQPAGSFPVPPLSSSSPSLHRFLSFMSLFNRNPVLRDSLTKLPGKSVYFEALLPSRAVSLNILSSLGFIKPSPPACGSCFQHREAPRTQPRPWVAFAQQCCFCFAIPAWCLVAGLDDLRGLLPT